MPQLFSFTLASILFAGLIIAATLVIVYFLWKIKGQLNDKSSTENYYYEDSYKDAYKILPDAILVLNDKNQIL